MTRESADLTGMRILIVEDTLLIADLLCDHLESCGCQVIGPASDVEQGLPLAKSKPLDGAFLDINLGGEYCFPIAVVLNERHVPFLFLTGYDDAAIIPANLRNVRRLRKPFDLDELTTVAARTFRALAA